MEERPIISLPEDDQALIAQCELESFRSSGPGGQHVNTSDSAVRLRHLPSGIVVTSRTHRSQHRNRAECLLKLRERVRQLNQRRKRRKPTRKPGSVQSREKRLNLQHKHKKNLRRPPGADE